MSLLRRTFLSDIFGGGALLRAAPASSPAPGQDFGPGAVNCRVVDGESGNPVAARIRLTNSQGDEVLPMGHPPQVAENGKEGDVRFQSRRFCYVDGSFAVDKTLLPLRYEIVRGHEYLIARGELRPPAAGRGDTTIALSRWSALSRRGWFSGDIHIHHISPQTCRLEMEAEDLHVANILTSDFTADQDQFEGRVNAHSRQGRLIYVNQEFRNPHLGHMCLLNLKRLIQPVTPQRSEGYPLHLRACEETREQGGYVSWAHFPSWPGVECPLDVAMEKLDGLEILSVLQPHGVPAFLRDIGPDWESNDGLRLWYRFLNCGFRLTATAGTDKMTPFVTVGANRVFARVDGDFNYRNWIEALKQGRTFVTNSPILSVTVNGQQPGAVLRLTSKRHPVVEIEARAECQFAYDRVEVICNGVVIADATPSGARHRAEVRLEHPVQTSCWIAARAYEKIDSYTARGVQFEKIHSTPATLLNDYFGTRRPEAVFAHTSPVYVVRDNMPIRNWEDAEYYVRYIDKCIQWLDTKAKFARPADKGASIEAFRVGRAVYQKRAQEARQISKALPKGAL
jgi:hypothetical protein